MNNQLITYYIPNNPNINKGTIYTLYSNKNSNLDLSSILNSQTVIINNIIDSNKGPIKKSSKIIMSGDDYTKLLELNNKAYELSNKHTAAIQAFIQAETKIVAEQAKINAERQELIKNQLRKENFNG